MKRDDYQKQLGRLLLKIPRGKVTTYKAIAEALGLKSFRFAGQLLHRNPDPNRIPCFKVVKSDGTLGGFALGKSDKIRRLKKEGIRVFGNHLVDFKERFYSFR